MIETTIVVNGHKIKVTKCDDTPIQEIIEHCERIEGKWHPEVCGEGPIEDILKQTMVGYPDGR